MTDRELLEFAAKAAGIFLSRETLAERLPDWEWEDEFDSYHLPDGGMRGSVIWYGSDGDIGGTEGLDWNPLADDGDAFRLALRLRMTVRHDDVDACIAGWYANQAAPTIDGMGPWFWKEWNGNDPAAATRRAIVKAAAQIEAMNGSSNPLTLRVTMA